MLLAALCGPLPGAAKSIIRAGVLRDLGPYNALGRALWTPPWRGQEHCALEVLRWAVGGETMTTPGGAGTPRKACKQSLRARRTGYYHWVGAPTAPQATGLRPFTLPHPDALSPLPCAVVSAYTST
jgi:hypothetical protein